MSEVTSHPKVISTSVSKPKAVLWGDEVVMTGIFKEPVEGKIKVRKLNLDGDQQADLTVHGGPDKAIYSYPSEHYSFWKEEMPDRDLPWGMFGENLTTSGLNESSVFIGDRFSVGTAVLKVTQPRMPCFKLGIKFGDESIIRKFYRSGRWGLYFAVLEEGELEAGDDFFYQGGDGLQVRASDVIHVLTDRSASPDEISRIINSNLADQMKSAVSRLRGKA